MKSLILKPRNVATSGLILQNMDSLTQRRDVSILAATDPSDLHAKLNVMEILNLFLDAF